AGSVAIEDFRGIETQPVQIEAFDKRLVNQGAFVSHNRSSDVDNDETGHLFQIGELLVQYLPCLLKRYAGLVERLLSAEESSHLREIVVDDPWWTFSRSLLPLIVSADERLNILVDWPEL